MRPPSPAPITTGHDAAEFSIHQIFRRFAAATSAAAGSAWTFVGATCFLILWACSYPLFLGDKEPFNTWQLVINTVTTIVTFLMVFLIQNAQNRDAKALHLKLDELIRAMGGARNRLVELENCSDEELDLLKKQFERIRVQANGKADGESEKEIAAVEVERQNRERG